MKSDILKYVADKDDEGVKLDSILRTRLNLSRRMIIWLKKTNNIFLNDQPVFVSAVVKMGDVISVNIAKDESQDIEPQDMPLSIIFEDRDLLVVDKQPGIVVHPTKGHPEGTLSNAIIYHWRKNGEDTIVRLVNRLDRDTSGLVMVAKNQFSHQAMAKQLDANQVQKIYIAVAHGVVADDSGTIDMPIDRPSRESIKREIMETGLRAVTHFDVLKRFDEATLLKIYLETGKTHQIRVHMSHLGHPLFGDTLYGEYDDSLFIGRQALHAASLKFIHPRTGEQLNLGAQLPNDMKALIRRLEKNP